MSKFPIGSKVRVIGVDLTGWTGVVVAHYKHVHDACTVDLDPEQEPDLDIAGCYFNDNELELI